MELPSSVEKIVKIIKIRTVDLQRGLRNSQTLQGDEIQRTLVKQNTIQTELHCIYKAHSAYTFTSPSEPFLVPSHGAAAV